MDRKKVVLAYSGGLDTSVIVRWLVEEGYEVIALCLDLGQKTESFDELRDKGRKAGASEVVVLDVKEEFARDFVIPSLQMNAVYEGAYLLGTSLARPLIAKKQIEVARRFGASAVSHGATGKGNDQVRFEMGYLCLEPDIEIVAPWKIERFYKKYPGRAELMEYAGRHGIPVKATKDRPWSSDENLMHISFEAGMLENPWQKPLAEMFELSRSPKEAPDEETELEIEFDRGTPVRLNGETLSPAAMIETLNELAGKNGIGRRDLVETRFVGMKSRGVYETPGCTVLMEAHRAIESITLTGDVIELKESLMPRFASAVYKGFWFTPSTRLMLDLVEQSQKEVSGTVRLELYKGNVTITGRKSETGLYDEDIASMEKDRGNYDVADAVGFIKLNALPYRIHSSRTGG